MVHTIRVEGKWLQQLWQPLNSLIILIHSCFLDSFSVWWWTTFIHALFNCDISVQLHPSFPLFDILKAVHTHTVVACSTHMWGGENLCILIRYSRKVLCIYICLKIWKVSDSTLHLKAVHTCTVVAHTCARCGKCDLRGGENVCMYVTRYSRKVYMYIYICLKIWKVSDSTLHSRCWPMLEGWFWNGSNVQCIQLSR